MKHLVSKQLYAYWHGLRGTRSAPERSDLDPAAIRTILADTFLVDVVGNQTSGIRDFIIRLSGTRLDALWGEELKGRSLLSLWRREDGTAVRDLMDLVMDDQVAVVAGAFCGGPEKRTIEFEMLLLPLRHHGKTHARLIGSIVTNAPQQALGLQPIGELILTSFRSIRSGYPPDIGHRTSSFARHSPPPVQHGRFMVYEGGR